ncbi:protein disulfide-isomerase-like [Amaranthus tricolor]|uniref:protein disulfide-isomerase-like n=1 Tax=Amaranthus tricolor TaxID=29722 RepID=UPI00258A7A6A|nr:protein disulfide-isomerase-like [Amaranthus tricolor]
MNLKQKARVNWLKEGDTNSKCFHSLVKENTMRNRIDNGKLELFLRSQPIPQENNEPVKVVVLDSLQDMVFNSRKDVFLEFYAPWCEHCNNLAPILDEVAILYEKDPNILIAKYDKSANDIPSGAFEVQGFPIMYFIKKNGEIIKYDGGRTKEDLISFIEEHKSDKKSKSEVESIKSKDEL